MKQEQLALLVERLEIYAQRNPGVYRFRVALPAALGYFYLLMIIHLLLSIVGLTLYTGKINFLVLKVLWIPLVLVGLVLRSLWITIPEPDGRELNYEQAPKLFELVQEVRTMKRHYAALPQMSDLTLIHTGLQPGARSQPKDPEPF
jgi:hypothetical protein